jgi:thiol-disulfide isomerase/thioredoxin
MKTRALIVLTMSVTAAGRAQDVPDAPAALDWRATTERRIVGEIGAAGLQTLTCDFVLNSRKQPSVVSAAVAGKTTVLNFWRPSCEFCKPVLTELAKLAASRPRDVIVLAAVEGDGSHGESVDEGAARQRAETVVEMIGGLPFPVCGYIDHEQSRRWQAEGVPITFVFDKNGRIARAALGGESGTALVKELRAGWRPRK